VFGCDTLIDLPPFVVSHFQPARDFFESAMATAANFIAKNGRTLTDARRIGGDFGRRKSRRAI
jgi:hypothetical protein